jgi:hypothetical protein
LESATAEDVLDIPLNNMPILNSNSSRALQLPEIGKQKFKFAPESKESLPNIHQHDGRSSIQLDDRVASLATLDGYGALPTRNREKFN